MKLENLPEPLKMLREAEAVYLTANGWIKHDDKRWVSPCKALYVFPGDKLFQRNAVDVQKDIDSDHSAGL